MFYPTAIQSNAGIGFGILQVTNRQKYSYSPPQSPRAIYKNIQITELDEIKPHALNSILSIEIVLSGSKIFILGRFLINIKTFFNMPKDLVNS